MALRGKKKYTKCGNEASTVSCFFSVSPSIDMVQAGTGLFQDFVVQFSRFCSLTDVLRISVKCPVLYPAVWLTLHNGDHCSTTKRALSLQILNHMPNMIWMQDFGDYFSLSHRPALTRGGRVCSLFILVRANSAAMGDVTLKAMLWWIFYFKVTVRKGPGTSILKGLH